MQWLGFSLVGPLINRALGPSVVVLLAIGLLALSSVLVARLPHDRATRWPTGLRPRALMTAVGQDLRAGIAAIWRDPPLVKALGSLSLASVTLFMLGTLGPGYFTRVLGGAVNDLGLVLTPPILGGGLGLLLVNATASAGNRQRLIDRGILVAGLTTLVMALAPAALAPATDGGPLPALVLAGLVVTSILLGGSLAFILMPGLAILQSRAPETMRARVYAAYYTLSSTAAIVPTLLAGVLGDLLGVALTLGLIGLTLTLLGLVAIWRTRQAIPAAS
jgi:hypothetical protein